MKKLADLKTRERLNESMAAPFQGLDRLPPSFRSAPYLLRNFQPYSSLSASIGSTEAARRAGMNAASVPTRSKRTTTLA